MRRIPILATLIVFAAVGLMIAMGIWQLDRLHQKEALLARYAAARNDPALVEWTSAGVDEGLLYRRAHLTCAAIGTRSSMAGRNAAGQSGVAQTAQCTLPGGGRALVVMGWSLQPNAGAWQGGEVTGVIAPGPRLVAVPAVGGLGENAIPDPVELPNNHLSYAGQWFFFAGTALVIYFLAMRKRK